MIFRDKISRRKIVSNLEKILKENGIKSFRFNNKTNDSSCLLTKDDKGIKESIEIGIKELHLFNSNAIFVKKVVDVYHEIEHYNQHQVLLDFLSNEKQNLSQEELEICCTLALKSKYKGVENKYSMLPSEISAEIVGILDAQEYINSNHPNIDFEKCILEYVNSVKRWYGHNSLKEERPTFESLDDVLVYLHKNLEISYDYPCYMEYNGFSDKMESIRVANLSSGAEQFYQIAKDLYGKGLLKKTAFDGTTCLNNFYNKGREESVDDVILNIKKEGVRQFGLIKTTSTKELENTAQNGIDNT